MSRHVLLLISSLTFVGFQINIECGEVLTFQFLLLGIFLYFSAV